MRIIGGKNRGCKLLLPDPAYTRPTTDRVREAIFNILMHHPDVSLVGGRALDAFAGSGAMGLEALSRGAEHVTFVESNPKVARVLQQNIELFSSAEQTYLIRGDLATIKAAPDRMDLVFLDPPYGKELEFKAIPYLQDQGWIVQKTMIVYETDGKTDITPLLPRVEILEERHYGGVKVYLLKMRTI